MNFKDANLKEKLKQALNSTARAISDDFQINESSDNNKNSKKFDFFELLFSTISSVILKSSEITLAVDDKACLSFSFKLESLLFI